MAIKLDVSPSSVVVYCEECGHWRAFAWTVLEGHQSAVRHELNVHIESEQARQAQRRYLTRHADQTVIVTTDPEYSLHGIS
jgi:hypothetical protein